MAKHKHQLTEKPGRTRREFLKVATAMAAGALAAPWASGESAATLPAVPLGSSRVTRLIAGGNPLYGYSHFNRQLDQAMVEYFTDARVVQFVLDCEKAGINTWQSNFKDRARRQYPKIREAGCKMHWICLADPFDVDRSATTPEAFDAAIAKVLSYAVPAKPIGIAHHGGVTDTLYRAGKLDQVRTFLNRVHDAGLPAGVSTHNPTVLEEIESKGWPTDFYMGCFYRVTRVAEEYQKEFGTVPEGEGFFASDPPRMCSVLRQIQKPCLGFKILAAGRRCDSLEQLRQAFEFAFRNLKPTDAVIVGMYPRYSDQISENVRLVKEICA